MGNCFGNNSSSQRRPAANRTPRNVAMRQVTAGDGGDGGAAVNYSRAESTYLVVDAGHLRSCSSGQLDWPNREHELEEFGRFLDAYEAMVQQRFGMNSGWTQKVWLDGMVIDVRAEHHNRMNDKRRSFYRALERMLEKRGYRVIMRMNKKYTAVCSDYSCQCPHKNRDNGVVTQVQGGVDVAVATEMLRIAGDESQFQSQRPYNVALVAGDGDFGPCLQQLHKNSRFNLMVVSEERKMSNKLRQFCDHDDVFLVSYQQMQNCVDASKRTAVEVKAPAPRPEKSRDHNRSWADKLADVAVTVTDNVTNNNKDTDAGNGGWTKVENRNSSRRDDDYQQATCSHGSCSVTFRCHHRFLNNPLCRDHRPRRK